MPLPYWPDGRWCFEVAMYLSNKGRLSKQSRGGSYAATAYALSELIRFCFDNRIGFLELTDSQFVLFLRGLSAQVESLSGAFVSPRSANRIITIGRQVLAFLEQVGHYYGRPGFVGPHGTILGFMRRYTVPSKKAGGQDTIKYCWHHSEFPEHSPYTRRHPIGDEYVSRLRSAVLRSTLKSFLRQRRLLLIRLLDATGARRIELANLTVQSVMDALAMLKRGEKPFLRIPTYKKRGAPRHRLLPVDDVLVAALVDFVEMYRAPVMAKARLDCDFVLVSTKGTQLKPNTITLEIFLLRKIAGITGKAHPHLFRHRYICRRIAELIARERINSTADLVSYLLGKTAALTKLLEETGQASVDALTPYIDDVFLAKRHPQRMVQGEDLSRLSMSLDVAVEELRLLEAEMSAEEFAARVFSNFEAFSAALKRPQ